MVMNVDIETYSDADLTKTGAYAYAASPAFEILLIGYSLDDGPVEVIDLTEYTDLGMWDVPEERLDSLREICPEFVRGLLDPECIKTAYNANFERTCLAAYLKEPMPPEQWRCTAVHAATLGLPGTLGGVGEALGLPEDKQKDKVGKALIRYFCKPCEPTKANKGRTRNMPYHDPEKWKTFVEYNRQDVVTEKAIREKIVKYRIPEGEQELWSLDQRMNDRGVLMDMDLVESILKFDKTYQAKLLDEAMKLTGLSNPNSLPQLKAWLLETYGLEVTSLTKDTLPGLMEKLKDSPRGLRVLQIRAELGKVSTKKYAAMKNAVCPDGRLRGILQFYGASRTGRWCLTGDHEVLTDEGWTRLDEWQGGKILCWNSATEALSFQKSDPVCFDYDGEMITFTGQRIEQIATPEHKMPVLGKNGRWEPKEADRITGRFTIPFTGKRQPKTAGLSDELRVLIMTQADGHYAENGIIKYHFSKERKIERCKRLLRRAGIPFVEDRWTPETANITVQSQNVPLWLRQFKDKTFGYWLLDEDLTVLFDELCEWDGYRSGPNSIQYVSINEQNVDVLQACALCAGLSATKVKKNRSDNPNWSDAYILNIWLTPGRGTAVRKEQISSIEYSGKVYCAKTPTGYFAVRRNGKVWITGNSGRIVQTHNLPQNKIPDIGLARQLARDGDFEFMQELFDEGIPFIFSQLVRTVFIPSNGCKFVVADFSAIEARVIAWLAGEEWVLQAFRDGKDIYCETASQMYHVPVEKHGVNAHLRQKGKIATLACGYQGGIGAMKAMDRSGSIPEEEMQNVVNQWRRANPHIVKLWYDLESAAKTAIRERRKVTRCIRTAAHNLENREYMAGGSVRPYGKREGAPPIEFTYVNKNLFIKLPSGRKLCYWNAKVEEQADGRDHITYSGVNQMSRKWERQETYSGKIAENLTQAIARDCLAVSMTRVTEAGYSIVMHIHDEMVCDVPDAGKEDLDRILEIMGSPIPWAPGLPLRGDGYLTPFYRKD